MDKEVVHVTIIRDGSQHAKSDKNVYSQYKMFDDLDNIDVVDEMDSYNIKMSEEIKAFQTEPLTPQVQILIDGTYDGSSKGKLANIEHEPIKFDKVNISADNLNFGAVKEDSKNYLNHRRNFNHIRISKESFNNETNSPGRRADTPRSLTNLGPTSKAKFGPNVAEVAFLISLLWDMGISIGDTVTDFLQGFDLIWNFTEGTIRYATLYYGIAVILISWLPAIFCLVHLWFTEELDKYVKKESLFSFIALVPFFIVFFPIVPTLFYLHLLCQKEATREDRARYRRLENRAKEIKSIAEVIEAPLQLIITLWLMLRGILSMPWNEPLSSTCMEDSLGRIVCFRSSNTMFSLCFSMLSILNATFNLNVSPILKTKMGRTPGLQQRFSYLLPFIFVYLEYWAIFPCILLFVLNLVNFCIHSTDRPENSHESNHILPSLQLKVSPKTPTMLPHSETQSTYITLDDPLDDPPLMSDKKKMTNYEITSWYINEENAQIFLNAIVGMFSPSFHTYLPEYVKANEHFDRLPRWQRQLFGSQVIYFNLINYFILFVVNILVSDMESYNY